MDNALIADIPNATIAENFEQVEPSAGIARVEVTGLPGDRVRVAITGTDAPPVAEIRGEAQGLVFGVTTGTMTGEQEEEIEIVVTGEQEEGYRIPNASVGTRTDTPLRDIPQSIQVVPQQVLQDQQVNTLNEALQNVSGVIQTGANYSQFNSFTIRGFEASEDGNYSRNGLSYRFGSQSTNFSNIERIEVLRGPASVLFGQGSPGGTINIVTKQPLRDPFYSIEGIIGNYDFYRGAIDLSGPLDDSRTVLYRLNASYENTDSFVDFINRDNPSIASTLKFAISNSTTLTLDAEYNRINQSYPQGLPAVGTVFSNPNGEISRNRNIGQPNGSYSPEVVRVGYNLEHRFSENWSLRNAFYFMPFTFHTSISKIEIVTLPGVSIPINERYSVAFKIQMIGIKPLTSSRILWVTSQLAPSGISFYSVLI